MELRFYISRHNRTTIYITNSSGSLSLRICIGFSLERLIRGMMSIFFLLSFNILLTMKVTLMSVMSDNKVIWRYNRPARIVCFEYIVHYGSIIVSLMFNYEYIF